MHFSPLSSTPVMGSGTPESKDCDSGNDKLPANSELVWDLVLQVDAYKSIRPDGLHPRELKELADVIVRPHYLSAVLGI